MAETVTTMAGQCREKRFVVTESNPARNGCNGEALDLCPSPTGDTKPPPWVDLTDIEVSLSTKEKRPETAVKTSTRYQKES
uniref:Uncharacterized protein n=1 Tax=Nomascus leucogenys TaxID=61853 RepID=A0A2I3HKP0_NOMLE